MEDIDQNEKDGTATEKGLHHAKLCEIISNFIPLEQQDVDLIKSVFMLDTAEEIVIHLFAPNSFAASISSFFLGKNSEDALEAITDCEYIYITKTNLEKLYATHCKWESFGRQLMEHHLLEKEQRVIDQLSLTAHDRYLKIMNKHPEIIQNVPVKYIASFIGIQPESLSRIRKVN